MLLQFTVENFLSFDEAETFSMVAARDKDHPHHLIEGAPPALRGAAICGANASGKSNLVLAMHFARELIVRGRRNDQAIGARAFALNEAKESRPSGFHWVFRHAGKIWSYGFDVSARAVVEEYLVARSESGGREKNWFKRTTDEQGKSQVKFGDAMKAETKEPHLLRFLERSLRPEQPLLTHAIENNYEGLMPVWEWFDDGLRILRSEETLKNLNLSLEEAGSLVKFIGELLRFADTGIEKLVLERTPWHEDMLSDELDDESQQITENIFRPELPRCFLDFTRDSGPLGIECDTEGNFWTLRFKTQHARDGENYLFPVEWESEGTRRLMQLAPVLFFLRQDNFVFVIDELDRRLHTLLVREFVRIGLRTGLGQLIFTTHDSNLLDANQLRRDEIHFVQKDEGRSHLSRLSDWKVRKDLDYEKAYLLGMFEGRPHFGFSPSLQGLNVPDEAVPPTREELQAQLQGVV